MSYISCSSWAVIGKRSAPHLAPKCFITVKLNVHSEWSISDYVLCQFTPRPFLKCSFKDYGRY